MAELSQTDAAAQLGVSNVHLCNVERGRSLPGFSLLAKAAELYGIDPYDVARRQTVRQ
jgi:transcriptional regulator with XRE-family HTH domain